MYLSVLKERFKESFERYYEDGSLLSVYDQEKGIGLIYYPSGSLEGIVPIKDGLPDGLMKRFYEDGTLNWESCIKKGRLEGPTREYDKDLDVHISKYFCNNEQIIFIAFDNQGRVIYSLSNNETLH